MTDRAAIATGYRPASSPEDFDLLDAADNADLDRLRDTLAASPLSACVQDHKGRDALDVAIACDFLAGARILAPLSGRGRRGETRIAMAARFGAEACLSFFLSEESPLRENPREADDEGITPLMLAAERGYPHCVRLLAPFSDANAQSRNGRTALFFAIQEFSVACVARLQPLSDLSLVDSLGSTPLAQALLLRAPAGIVAALAPGSDLGAQDKNGRTPLTLAFQRLLRDQASGLLDILCPLATEHNLRDLIARFPSALVESPAVRRRFEFFELQESVREEKTAESLSRRPPRAL